MHHKIRIAYISAEASPYAKSGESADVASALPKYLASLGIEVSLFTSWLSKSQGSDL